MSLQFSSHTQKIIEHFINIDQGISNSFTFDTYFIYFIIYYLFYYLFILFIFIYLYVLLSFD